jgi:hypothetical protein
LISVTVIEGQQGSARIALNTSLTVVVQASDEVGERENLS